MTSPNANPHGNLPGGETPPNPFVNPPELPAVPVVPGFDQQAGKASIVTMHNLLIVVVLLISAAAIFGLRKIGLSGAKTSASAAATEADAAPFRMDPAANRALIEDLSATRTSNQVLLDELKQNPFASARWMQPEPEPAAADPEAPKTTVGKSAEEIARELDEAAVAELKTFNLQSVMGGSRPVARINGEIYQVGDTLGKMTTITWIEGRTVEVEANGKTYTLTMGK